MMKCRTSPDLKGQSPVGSSIGTDLLVIWLEDIPNVGFALSDSAGEKYQRKVLFPMRGNKVP
jgi:hypothetical protein